MISSGLSQAAGESNYEIGKEIASFLCRLPVSSFRALMQLVITSYHVGSRFKKKPTILSPFQMFSRHCTIKYNSMEKSANLIEIERLKNEK